MAPPNIEEYGDEDGESDLAVAPLSNPPLDHLLLSTKYDSLDALMEDLHEFRSKGIGATD